MPLATVDLSSAWHAFEAVAHQTVRRLENGTELVVGDVGEATPR